MLGTVAGTPQSPPEHESDGRSTRTDPIGYACISCSMGAPVSAPVPETVIPIQFVP